MAILTKALIDKIRSDFKLDWKGIHGVPHWARVRINGFRLSEETGANKTIIELFAFLHDSMRIDDGVDPFHGGRAAQYAEKLKDNILI